MCFTRPNNTYYLNNKITMYYIKITTNTKRAVFETDMTHRVYGMVHSRPTLLQHEIGFLAANWTTAVIVSEKAALT